MNYIQSASSITHQATFQQAGFFSSIQKLAQDAELVQPNYKDFITPKALRRMNKILRMSLTCAKDCLAQANVEQPGALIVGTGLGALEDTEKFLKNFIDAKDGLIPPTSFIQSTHNTMAGQLSLILKNHSYNMTHTQNSLSFELAMQDALLCLDEGTENVLLGAADERIDFLDFLLKKLNVDNLQLTSGSSFFVFSKEKNQNTLAKIADVQTVGLCADFETSATAFLEKNKLKTSAIDLLLFSAPDEKQSLETQTFFKGIETKNYTKYSGAYMTNAAFAMHWAADLIQQKQQQRVLICNRLNPKNVGFTLIENCET